MAIRMTWTALPITSAGRFSPLGPVGIFFNHRFEFGNSASEITRAIFPKVPKRDFSRFDIPQHGFLIFQFILQFLKFRRLWHAYLLLCAKHSRELVAARAVVKGLKFQTWGNRWERCLQGLIRIGEAGAAAPRRCHGHHEWLDQKSSARANGIQGEQP